MGLGGWVGRSVVEGRDFCWRRQVGPPGGCVSAISFTERLDKHVLRLSFQRQTNVNTKRVSRDLTVVVERERGT